mgnify:CR=1 FL=1
MDENKKRCDECRYFFKHYVLDNGRYSLTTCGPYLRAAVTNLTASAYIAPLNLPVISGPIFPEDRDRF